MMPYKVSRYWNFPLEIHEQKQESSSIRIHPEFQLYFHWVCRVIYTAWQFPWGMRCASILNNLAELLTQIKISKRSTANSKSKVRETSESFLEDDVAQNTNASLQHKRIPYIIYVRFPKSQHTPSRQFIALASTSPPLFLFSSPRRIRNWLM